MIAHLPKARPRLLNKTNKTEGTHTPSVISILLGTLAYVRPPPLLSTRYHHFNLVGLARGIEPAGEERCGGGDGGGGADVEACALVARGGSVGINEFTGNRRALR